MKLPFFPFALSVCTVLANLALCAPSHAQERLIALDIGHYQQKPGAASARGAREFDFNLALGQSLAAQLQASRQAYLMIGADGMASDLPARAAQAASAGATLLLSLHHDSVQEQFLQNWQWQGVNRRFSRHASGYSLFVSRKNPQWRASLDCARALSRQLQEAGFQNSRHHAENIPGENRPWADEALGIHFFDDLLVLKSARMPALLFEAGVLPHPEEESALQDPARRARMSAALQRGLQECLQTAP